MIGDIGSIESTKEALETFRWVNEHGGNWETHEAECALERRLLEAETKK